jgi:hypothetical protein
MGGIGEIDEFHPEQAHIIGKLSGYATLLDLGHYLAK